MKNILAILFTLYIFTLTSCVFDKTKEETIPEYNANVVWTLETYSVTGTNHLQRDKYMYCIENTEETNYFCVSKIDLSVGERIWKSNKIEGSPGVRPFYYEINNKGYILMEEYNSKKLYCFDDFTGELCATIIFTENSKELTWYTYGQFITANGNLYKPMRKKISEGNYGCLGKININEIDFSISPEIPQLIKTEILLEKEQIACVTPVEKDGVIFLNTYDSYPKKGYTYVIAYDTNTNTVKWEYKTSVLDGHGRFNMYIVDNLLYIIEEQIACFNIESGECIYEYKETEEDLATKISKGGSIWSQGLWYDDGKFYYTSNASWATPSMTNIPEELVRNVLCLDAKTFELVWSDFPEGCGSLFTRPVVIDGKCFVLVNDGLRVYNSKTGELIGRASEVNGSEHSLNAEYNGMFIYFDIDDLQKTSTLTAIRP